MKNFKIFTKKPIYRTFMVVFLQCVSLLCYTINMSAFAGPASGPQPQPQCTICTLNSSINNNHNALLTVLESYFITGLQNQTSSSTPKALPNPLNFDLFNHYKTISNIDIIAADQSLENYTSVISSNLVAYYLAGIDVKNSDAQQLNATEGEDTSGTQPTLTSYVKVLSATTANTNTAAMNMDTLLGPLQYNSDQQNQAQEFLLYMENLSPIPDIIRIGNQFTIPYTDPTNKNPVTIIDLTKLPKDPDNPNRFSQLKAFLANDLTYTKYKTFYRSSVAARTAFMNSLLRIYQERTAPTDPTKKSIAAANYESATWRLRQSTNPKQKSYMDDIKQASPATISRETLLLLAEIHYDLYKIQQQNEQLIALQSLNNLQLGQMTSMAGGTMSQKAAKAVFCWYDQQQNGGTNNNSDCSQDQNQGTQTPPSTNIIPSAPTS